MITLLKIYSVAFERIDRVYKFSWRTCFWLGQGEISRMNDCKRGPHHRPTIRMNDFIFPVFDCCVLLYLQAFTTQNRKSFVSIRRARGCFFPHHRARAKRWKQMHFSKNKILKKANFGFYFQVQGHKYETKCIFIRLIIISFAI